MFLNELKIRFFYIFLIIIFTTVILFNNIYQFTLEYIFYDDLNLNIIENSFYSTMYSRHTNNNNCNFLESSIEYDWYISYNIFINNIYIDRMHFINMYFYIFYLYIVPYFTYELWLFIIPALYKNEIFFFNTWILGVIIMCLNWYTNLDMIFSNLLFLWEEQADIFFFNEFIDNYLSMNYYFTFYKIYIIYYLINYNILFIFSYLTTVFINRRIIDRQLRLFFYILNLIILLILNLYFNVCQIIVFELIISIFLCIELSLVLYNVYKIHYK